LIQNKSIINANPSQRNTSFASRYYYHPFFITPVTTDVKSQFQQAVSQNETVCRY